MATWIVHLRVAQNMLSTIDGLDAEQFIIGNLGPDLNVQSEDWESFLPPGDVTHFRKSNEDEFWSSDLEYYRNYLADLHWPGEDPLRFSFLLGYFVHLLTDNLWHQKVGAPTQVRYADQFETDPDFIWEVKRDWYGLDFIYLRDHPDNGFWGPFIDSAYHHDYLDFFPPETIQEKLEYIKSFYQLRDDKVDALFNRDFVFLSKDRMDEFITQASARIYRIYEQLWKENKEIEGYTSALDLPVA